MPSNPAISPSGFLLAVRLKSQVRLSPSRFCTLHSKSLRKPATATSPISWWGFGGGRIKSAKVAFDISSSFVGYPRILSPASFMSKNLPSRSRTIMMSMDPSNMRRYFSSDLLSSSVRWRTISSKLRLSHISSSLAFSMALLSLRIWRLIR